MTKHIGFLLFDDFEDLDFVGPWEMFGLWNRFHQGPALSIITEKGGNVTSVKGLTIANTLSFADIDKLDYLLVPGGQGTRREVDNKTLIDFVRRQAVFCEYVLSVCTGAFILEKAGLLKQKQATTHWASFERLKACSEVKSIAKRFVYDHPIWTSAGVSAGIDMSLAFIAHVAGAEIAGKIQLFAEYYPEVPLYPVKDQLPSYVIK